ncbi:MAG: rhamnogalacturonan lyase [Planctomycetales bacterium]|nr:rhamnogalacturonan lyase [Planctomycetales bacterium]
MDSYKSQRLASFLLGMCFWSIGAAAEPVRQLEYLDRGLVAIPYGEDSVFLSWRWLGDESDAVAFNVYRSENGAPVKLNADPIADRTNLIVPAGAEPQDDRYAVRRVIAGVESADTQWVPVWNSGYLDIPIQAVEDYRPGDASVGDLDGDGQLEIVLHQTSRPRDNSHSGLTGSPILDAYTLEGKHLWRINLGRNIRDGEHYTQFMVYDLDGDGRAEIACKTADGTVDGQGRVIGDENADYRVMDQADKRFGRVLDGPEFLTIFDGRSGKALQTVDYVPNRYPIDGWGGIGGNGGNDSYGNRCDRFLACVAYLDGQRPSLVMCRGVYGRIVLAAWDWRDSQLSQRWVFDSGSSHPPYSDASPYSGMGGHSLSVADVDLDGKDEIVYQAMVIDDDGQGLYSTGLRHGDAMHISDMYPDRPGLEVFSVQENEEATVRFQTPGVAMRDAATGQILWSHSPGVDVTSGLAADIDPRFPGYEAWGGPGGMRLADGRDAIHKPRTTNFAIWWDGDLLRELIARSSTISKWNWQSEREERIFEADARGASRGPNLVADLVGDWREELLLTSPDGQSLRLYSTTHPSEYRIRTLLHDAQYRLAIAWQNVVYNKPAHPSFFLGHNMTPPSQPRIKVIR